MSVCQTMIICQNMNADHIATEGVLEPLLNTTEFTKTVATICAKFVLAVDTSSIQLNIMSALCVDHRAVIRLILLDLEDSVDADSVLEVSEDSADADSVSDSRFSRFSHSSHSGVLDVFVDFN